MLNLEWIRSNDKANETDGILPIIKSNYTVLHFDEFPILFCGVNLYGDNIIGSILCEHDTEDSIIYLHIIVNAIDYDLFLKQKISYRKLILSRTSVFLIEKNTNEEVLSVYKISPLNIPEEYLPHDDVKIPALLTISNSDINKGNEIPNYLNEYLMHSRLPPSRSDGLCIMCVRNKGNCFFTYKKVENGYIQDNDRNICHKCQSEISKYDTLHYG